MVLRTAERECRVLPQRRGLEVQAHPARLGDACRILRETVAEVEHRGRPRERREHAVGDGRCWATLGERSVSDRGGARGIRLACFVGPLREEHAKPLGRCAERTGDGDDIADPRTGADDRRPALEITEGRHRERHGRRHREVAADNAAARRERRTRLPEPIRDRLEHRDGRRTRQRERDDEGRRHGTHRRDIREVRRRSLPAEVVRARPREPEVRTVDHHVGRDDEAPIGRRDHRRIVARTEDGRIRIGKTGEDAPQRR
jgi:hypothetical protein